MSNLENKLKKIIDTFNNVNKEIAFKDIKKLSEKYNKNISVQNVLFQVAKKVGDLDTSIRALKKIVFIENNNNLSKILSKIKKMRNETKINNLNFKQNYNIKKVINCFFGS